MLRNDELHSIEVVASRHFENTSGPVALVEIRTVDRERWLHRLGLLSAPEMANVLNVMREVLEA